MRELSLLWVQLSKCFVSGKAGIEIEVECEGMED